jgi:hypothetical protein
MHKIMKCYDHVTELSSELNRELFTRHGMHLNKRGKAEIAKHIIEACKQIAQPQKNMLPISLPWKEIGNHKIKLQIDNYQDINDFSKLTIGQNTEMVRKSNRPKKPLSAKTRILWQKSNLLQNSLLKKGTDRNDVNKPFNVFHQNIRGLRGKIN